MPRSALVVGGGPAGASAAIGLKRTGLEVTLVEQRTTWQGRICTCFLAPDAVGELERLGILGSLREAGAADVKSATVTFPTGEPMHVDVRRGGVSGLALSRQLLEEALLEEARRAGVAVEMGTKASAVHPDGNRWIVSLRDARDRTSRRRFTMVVLADGYHTIAADAGSNPGRGWFGWNASFSGSSRTPGTLSLHAFPGGHVCVQDCGCGVTTVTGMTWHGRGQTRPWQAEFDGAVERSKPLRDALYGLTRTEEWRGGGPIPFRHHLRAGTGPVTVGDAAAVSDPFIGDGLARALAAGPMLARAIAEAGNTNAAEIRRIHAKLWNARYSKRLADGPWIRALLKSKPLFKAAEKFLFRRTPLVSKVISRWLAEPDRTPLPAPLPASSSAPGIPAPSVAHPV